MLQIQEIKDKNTYEKGLSKDSSFLQSWQYGELQSELSHTPIYLGIFSGEELIKSFLIIIFRAKRGTYMFSPYSKLSREEMATVIPFLKELSKKEKVDFIRFSPLLKDTDANKKLFKEFGFRDAPVHMMHPELIWQLDLNKDEDTLMKEMRKNTRYYVRRAKKDGVTIEKGNSQTMLDAFYDIHLDTAKRQGFTPYSKSFLDAQLKHFAKTNNIQVFLGKYEDKYIAGAVIMYYGDEGAYHHGASLAEFAKIPASYLIQWEAIKEAKERGYSRYNFWGVVEDAPKHPWAGLSFFKKGFGGEGVEILHCQDLPITNKYWFNWLVETLRRLKRGY